MSSAEQKRESLMGPLVTTAGILGTIQGFLWTLLSLIVILLYSGAYKITIDDDLVGVELGATIFKGYIDNEFSNPIKDDIIIRQEEFSYFMYLYMVLSFCLLVISSVVLWSSITGKGEKIYDKMIVSWTAVMVLLALLDVILMCLIASDYTKYKMHIKKLGLSEEKHTVVLTAVVIVMTAAARGYVLWIVNVVFAVILGRYYYSILTKGATRNQPVIDAYSAGSPPWPPSSIFSEPNAASEFDNKGFKNDNDIAPFPPAPPKSMDNWNARNNYYNSNNGDRGNDPNTRQITMAKFNRPNSNNNNWNDRNQDRLNNIPPSRSYPEQDPYHAPTYQKIAKIGRQGGQRSPPLSVAPPAIPEPDYDSPPGSPQVRGVLRPNSNYLY